MTLKLQLITFFVLLLCSAFFSSFETAFYSLNRIKVRNLLQQKVKGAVLLSKLKDNPRRVLSTLLVGNTAVNTGASALATVIATEYFGSTGVGVATGIVTFLVLIFGEITPKSLGIIYAEKYSLATAKIIYFLSYLLYPIIFLTENPVNILIKLIKADVSQPLITEQEIKTAVQMGAEENVIEKREKEMIDGALKFNDITAYEVRTPRIKMFCLSENLKLKDAMPQMIQEGFSRVPIYKATRDQISGIVYIKDLLLRIKEGKEELTLKDIAQKPLFVSKETPLSELFKELQLKHIHMAIVVDEYGGTSGLVTLEDLLEEIVGEITDETDLSPEAVKRIDKNTILVHGETEIEKVNRFFNVEIPVKKNYITISGFMHYLLKAIPKKGDASTYKNLTFTVEDNIDNKSPKIVIKKSE